MYIENTLINMYILNENFLKTQRFREQECYFAALGVQITKTTFYKNDDIGQKDKNVN